MASANGLAPRPGLGRDRTQTAVSIQIVCPSAQDAAAGELPRVSFAAADQIEAPQEDEIAEIGLIHRP